jgi:hypothetical protein
LALSNCASTLQDYLGFACHRALFCELALGL